MEEKWTGFIVGLAAGIFLTIVWWPTVTEWWFWRGTPYKWNCPECAKQGKFRAGARDVAALDVIVLQHKEKMHGA